MKLSRDEFEAKFREYRTALHREIGRFLDAASCLRQIDERTRDYLDELNLAPAFFYTAQGSLLDKVILWADKLFDEKGERGLFDFLKFIECNQEWMTVKELQRRKNFPDDHWMLRPEHRGPPITSEFIEENRRKIRGLAALPSIRLRRDKFHAHFDEDYFFDLKKLQTESPIEWADLTEVGKVMLGTLNDYSADFDGETFARETIGIDDLTRLLHRARKGGSK